MSSREQRSDADAKKAHANALQAMRRKMEEMVKATDPRGALARQSYASCKTHMDKQKFLAKFRQDTDFDWIREEKEHAESMQEEQGSKFVMWTHAMILDKEKDPEATQNIEDWCLQKGHPYTEICAIRKKRVFAYFEFFGSNTFKEKDKHSTTTSREDPLKQVMGKAAVKALPPGRASSSSAGSQRTPLPPTPSDTAGRKLALPAPSIPGSAKSSRKAGSAASVDKGSIGASEPPTKRPRPEPAPKPDKQRSKQIDAAFSSGDPKDALMVCQVETVTSDQLISEAGSCVCTKPLASQASKLSQELHKCCEALKAVIRGKGDTSNIEQLIQRSKQAHQKWTQMKANVKTMQEAYNTVAE